MPAIEVSYELEDEQKNNSKQESLDCSIEPGVRALVRRRRLGDPTVGGAEDDDEPGGKMR